MSGKVVKSDVEAGIYSNDEWAHRWQIGDTAFNVPQHDPFLDKTEKMMFEGKTKSVFVPLCGKTLDMIWMYERGHSICGVELFEEAITELFQEHGIPYEVQTVENIGKLYKSTNGRLQIYVADLFELNKDICGQFEVIWDHRSLIAINLVDHKRYSELMVSVMKPSAQCYIGTVEYDTTAWPGPPHSISDDSIQDLFKPTCYVETLEESTVNNQDLSKVAQLNPDQNDDTDQNRDTDQKADTDQNVDTEQKGGSESDKTSETNEQRQVKPAVVSEARLAIQKSSFLTRRWYKITLK